MGNPFSTRRSRGARRLRRTVGPRRPPHRTPPPQICKCQEHEWLWRSRHSRQHLIRCQCEEFYNEVIGAIHHSSSADVMSHIGAVFAKYEQPMEALTSAMRELNRGARN